MSQMLTEFEPQHNLQLYITKSRMKRPSVTLRLPVLWQGVVRQGHSPAVRQQALTLDTLFQGLGDSLTAQHPYQLERS